MKPTTNQQPATSIVPIIVWYNPETLGKNIAIENINTYSEYFEKVIIVDNSKEDNQNLCSNISNAIYLPNYKNVGIAKALNQGCKKAVEMNYEWALTMDQDSKWGNKKSLLYYLFQIDKLSKINNKNVSFSPNMVNIDTDKEDVSFNEEDNKCSNVKIAWTSGNVVKLSVWMKLNGFNESLFIDDVDHEFCYRLRGEGYNIIKIENSYMNHSIGEHNGVRYYYIVRNCLYMRKNFPEFWKEYNRLNYLLGIILGRIKKLHFSELKYILRGIFDAKKNRYGKYHE